ncbi:BZ3500_MvSof-1268-A1-R1_Chr7-3g09624 [Microbotryum saponariae]|uniref:galacturonan 1,4-alpha-galacturonidase n=1 Tax=Microbotryum saponariae TaxID=289078 RepID=A0A2X0L6G8_9BASI|nr:BZ3500_MvSof-1268-A1-R1_Chr7-3g09624 [Microbotryum saponariae]
MKIILAALPLSLAALAGARKHSSGHSGHRHRRASGGSRSFLGPPKTICRVPDVGVEQDSTPNIMAAFQKCQNDGKIVLDGNYLVKTLLYSPRLFNVEIELTGTRKLCPHSRTRSELGPEHRLIATVSYSDDIPYWSQPTTDIHGGGSFELDYQNATTFFFLQGESIWLHGNPASNGGKSSTFNGNGQKWWDKFAVDKEAGNPQGIESRQYARPIMLTIGNANNVKVEHINFQNGPFWNIFITNSKQVTMTNINIVAVSRSPALPYNTDGVDIYRSTDVTLLDFDVNNADDCVSLKPHSINVEVGRMACNGSHGISVGSLGQYSDEVDIVENVYIHDIVMSNAQAGARIKSWPNRNGTAKDAGGGSGYVKNVTFQNFVNRNVDQPLVLTSCYMHTEAYCAQFLSKMKISDVHYINVTGTASGKYKDVVALLDCSSECTNITAKGTHLSLPTSDTPVYICHNIDSEKQLDFTCTGSA